MPATDQRDSGRCWMFGALNLFRFGTREKLGVVDFEFSESYLYFWYMFEQSHFFLEFIIDHWERPLHDRELSDYIDSPADDGGDWGIAGLVPKTVYPESFTSGHTDELNSVLTKILRASARVLRQTLERGGTIEEAQQCKWKTVGDVYRILSIHLGGPPTEFRWQYRSSLTDGEVHQLHMTPHEFVISFVTVPYADYVSLIQDPRHEYNKAFAVENSMPLSGFSPTTFVNVSADEMKQICLSMLKDNLPVWFACNVGEECDNDDGLWDEHLYQTTQLYGFGECSSSRHENADKAERINYGSPMGTHVMLITGADYDLESCSGSDQPTVVSRWRVENSWGTNDAGDDGYYIMNDNWFEPNVFEIVAPLKYLSDQAKAAAKETPEILPPWDPMCARGNRRN